MKRTILCAIVTATIAAIAIVGCDKGTGDSNYNVGRLLSGFDAPPNPIGPVVPDTGNGGVDTMPVVIPPEKVWFTVTFDGNGHGYGNTPPAAEADSGDTITLPAMASIDNEYVPYYDEFTGWNTNSGGTGTAYLANSSYTVTGDVTLYAQWETKQKICNNIKFDGNGNTGGYIPLPEVIPCVGFCDGSVKWLALNGLVKTGYDFGGWSEDAEGFGTVYQPGTSSYTGCGPLYAVWIPIRYLNDDRDGKTYSTVKIGEQLWMAENLNYRVDSSWCYGNDNANCTKYGRLYQWSAAMGVDECYNSNNLNENHFQHQGVCPSGWHLPSSAEWDDLMEAVGGSSTAGTKLKADHGWNRNGNGTDEFGFSALPGGYRNSVGGFDYAGSDGYWWTATEYNANNAYIRYMFYSSDYVYSYYSSKSYGRSVRCVQD